MAERRDRAALLATEGYDVVQAATLEDGLNRATTVPNLVVLDLDARAARSASEAARTLLPCVFILQIGQASDGPFSEVVAEADAFLADPVDPRELLTLARALLRFQKVKRDLYESEQRLELAQESARLAVLDWSIASNRFVHSAVFSELFDLPELEAGEALSPALLLQRIHPDDAGPLLMEFSVESQTARSFEKEFRIICRSGAIRWISARGRFFIGPDGLPARMLALTFDITQRKEAERVNAQLASVVASSIDAIVSVDLDNRVTTWNAGAERLFGFTASEMIGRRLESALDHPDATVEAALRHRLAGGDTSVFETTQRTKAGDAIDVSVNSAPMHDPSGNAIGASLIIRDVAQQKRREDHVRFLMRELTHRSKNLLAVIQAMARQSLNKEITPEEFVKRFSNRLSALAGSHDLLSSVDWRGASLVELIRSQLRHYEDLFDLRIRLEGIDVTIRPEAAQNIGIALHELSTNAAKYGALSNSEGSVIIAWGLEQEPEMQRRLVLMWRETDGPPVRPPSRKGFGNIVMDRIAGQALNGRSGTQFLPSGVVWTLDVPAASVLCD